MAAVRRGANFRGLQMEWKGAFSRHFAINFSSASGFEARGGGGQASRGANRKLLLKPGLSEPKQRGVEAD